MEDLLGWVDPGVGVVGDEAKAGHVLARAVEARAGRLEAAGRSPFNEYFIPEAAVALKQGAGRLVRRESDRGVLVLCDTRLTTMGYGRRLLKALPPMRMLKSEEELLQVLRDLTGKRRAAPKFSCTPSGGLA